jgi:hypothetical protein
MSPSFLRSAYRQVLTAGFIAALARCVLAEEPLSPAQMDGLAVEALKHTPEHVHWAKGTRFSWVLFGVPADSKQIGIWNRIRAKLAERYQVFDSNDEIPAGLVQPDEIGACFVDGFSFTVSVRVIDSTTVEVTYSDFENSLAGSRQEIKYRWSGSCWRVRSKGPLVVS